jgi:hypothetical protein
MKKFIEAAFGAGNAICIDETNSNRIELFDQYDGPPATQRSYIKTEDTHPVHFTLHNPNMTPLTFVALDNCLLNSADPARCDCAIGNFEQLYLIEFKQVQTGQRAQARNAAGNQLSSALTIFRRRLPLQHTDLVAVICLKAKQPYPVRTARKVAEAFRFKTDYNARLVEGNEATFEPPANIN